MAECANASKGVSVVKMLVDFVGKNNHSAFDTHITDGQELMYGENFTEGIVAADVSNLSRSRKPWHIYGVLSTYHKGFSLLQTNEGNRTAASISFAAIARSMTRTEAR